MRSGIRQLRPRPAALGDDALHVGLGTPHKPHQTRRSVLNQAFTKLHRGDKRGGLDFNSHIGLFPRAQRPSNICLTCGFVPVGLGVKIAEA